MADSRRNGSRGRAGGAGGNGRSRTAASKSKGGGSGKRRRAKAARAAGLLRRALTWAAGAGVWCVVAFGGVLAWSAYDLPTPGELEKLTPRPNTTLLAADCTRPASARVPLAAAHPPPGRP